jgi:hypothetical protein
MVPINNQNTCKVIMHCETCSLEQVSSSSFDLDNEVGTAFQSAHRFVYAKSEHETVNKFVFDCLLVYRS